jgi:hypothetical protein
MTTDNELSYSGNRLEASTMYSRIKQSAPENLFLFHRSVRIKKPVSLHHLLQFWPEMVLWVHSSERVFHGTSRYITSIITCRNVALHAECFSKFSRSMLEYISVRFLPIAVCRLPPAVYFLYSLSYL